MLGTLIGKPDTVDTKYFEVVPRKGITVVDVYLKERIDVAKSFYKRYKNIDLFWEEQHDIFMKYVEILTDDEGRVDPDDVIQKFDDWLFDYCFGR